MNVSDATSEGRSSAYAAIAAPPVDHPARCTGREMPSARTSAYASSAQSRRPRVASMASGSVSPNPRMSGARNRYRPGAPGSRCS